MTKAEAIAFLTGINPVAVNMVTLDKATWDAFKVVALAALNAPAVDPKWEAAVRQIDAIDDALVG